MKPLCLGLPGNIVHGEPQAARSLADALRARFGWSALVAENGATVRLGA